MRKPASIVGIDPGTTTGIAILSLDGELMESKSSRNFPVKNVIGFISDRCTPLIIATDVTPVPKTVQKVAAAFPARIYEPEESLPRRTKEDMMRDFGFTGVA